MNRSGLKIMSKLIGLIMPLIHVMIAAVTMGVIGFLTAIFIIVLGGAGLLNILGFETGLSLSGIVIAIIACAVLRGMLIQFHLLLLLLLLL